MKTCFSAVTGYPGARSHFLGRLACIAFVSGSTISLSFAGFRDGGIRGSGGSFVGPVQRIGFTASHGNVDAQRMFEKSSTGIDHRGVMPITIDTEKLYDTDLTDAARALIAPMLPAAR